MPRRTLESEYKHDAPASELAWLPCADRQQVVFRAAALDELLSEDHPARLAYELFDGASQCVVRRTDRLGRVPKKGRFAARLTYR